MSCLEAERIAESEDQPLATNALLTLTGRHSQAGNACSVVMPVRAGIIQLAESDETLESHEQARDEVFAGVLLARGMPPTQRQPESDKTKAWPLQRQNCRT